MTYVFDTSAFSQLFRSYYRDRFPTLWNQFDQLVTGGAITSTREVGREIDDCPVESLRSWAKANKRLFPAPDRVEGQFVADIFKIRHFQQIIERKKLLKGGKNADPFVVARANGLEATVVTMEGKPPNGARIPNICDYFHIPCVSLEGFMEREQWQF